MVRVILVEDDSELRSLLVKSLTRHNIDTTGVGSAVEFYQQLAKQNFDIAVIDICLPDHSGFTIAEYLSKETNAGVIILSALNTPEDKIKAYESGADLFIAKPAATRELKLAIQNLAARVNASSEARDPQPIEVTTINAWTLDNEHWVLKAPCGHSSNLSAKEVLFVNTLAETVGHPVKRKKLLDTLDYPNNSHGSRALESMVLRLRKKLSACESGLIPIKTAHGTGYVFSSELVIN